MKKIVLLLALAITTVTTFAQDPINLITYKNQFGPWSEKDGSYVYEPSVYSTITFSFYSNYISVDDKNHSIYRITEDLPTTEKNGCKTSKSKCLDEQNNICLVAIVSYTDCRRSRIEIYYKEYSFKYTIDTQ